MVIDKDMLESARNGSGRKGQTNLIKYLEGGRLTQRQAIQAKCYDCNGMGESAECSTESCALWPYSQFAFKNASTSDIGNQTSATSC
jgi:hypothetical protein